MDKQQRRLISIDEACEEARVTRRTIYNWLQAGRVEFVRTAGGRLRIYQDSLYRPASGPKDHPGPKEFQK